LHGLEAGRGTSKLPNRSWARGVTTAAIAAIATTLYGAFAPSLALPRLEGGSLYLAFGLIGFCGGIASGCVRDAPVTLLSGVAAILVGGAVARALGPPMPSGDLDALGQLVALLLATTVFGAPGYALGVLAAKLGPRSGREAGNHPFGGIIQD